MRIAAIVASAFFTVSCVAQAPQNSSRQWTEFVQVEGQPEPVPTQWVATPEGTFAHSIKIPNAVPKDSGHKPTMSRKEYFDHLCTQEAGVFVFKTVDDVEGIYFARPPKRPSDSELSDRYKLEAPVVERYFQLIRATPAERSILFIHGGPRRYRFVEEPVLDTAGVARYVRAFGFIDQVRPRPVERVTTLKSQYGLTWRGLRRPFDREHAISGAEWIIFDLKSYEVLGLFRDYAMTGSTRNSPDGIWWMNAITCSTLREPSANRDDAQKLHYFVSDVLVPATRGEKQ